MTIKHLITLFFFSAAILLNSPHSLAAEHEGNDERESEFRWQLSAGLFALDMNMPKLVGTDSRFRGFTPLADITVEYKNFYVDSKLGDFYGGSDIGYQWIVEPDWGIDIIYGNYQLPFDETGYFNVEGDLPVPELRGIRKRESDQSFGLSYYRTYGNFQTSVEVVYDLLGDTKGWVIHAEATRNFELRNWDLWLNFGVNYYSQNFQNYFYGVTQEEVRANRPYFEAKASASAFLQFELNHPISESWVFSSGASLIWGLSNIQDSPLVERNYARVLFIGAKYVF
ncbi:MipA/OmpV family protein [Pseudoalteromonas fenneropenaei]|uniref:MipA/OmpV family protein n=1 Tax=Pseudoalteromonas fenneropenaei TaxID=1737459 RepID=A0ABV7CM59_9GAMM